MLYGLLGMVGDSELLPATAICMLEKCFAFDSHSLLYQISTMST
jgi:hypothetical protein